MQRKSDMHFQILRTHTWDLERYFYDEGRHLGSYMQVSDVLGEFGLYVYQCYNTKEVFFISLFKRDLNAATDDASLTSAGRSFHPRIVAGKKEFRNKSVLAR